MPSVARRLVLQKAVDEVEGFRDGGLVAKGHGEAIQGLCAHSLVAHLQVVVHFVLLQVPVWVVLDLREGRDGGREPVG